MVTLKRLPNRAAFSAISPDGEVVANAITCAFRGVFAAFVEKWRCVESLTPYAIMPDHIHLLVKLKSVEKPKSLSVIVYQLRVALTRAYWASVAPPRNAARQQGLSPQPIDQFCSLAQPRGCAANMVRAPARLIAPAPLPPVFEREWHDWIVMRKGQLTAFNRYIVENPKRVALRRAGIRRGRRSRFARRGACSTFRFTRRRHANQLTPNSTNAVTRWSISSVTN